MNKLIFIILSLFLVSLVVPITSADPAIMVTSYELDPSVLLPGDDAVLTVTLTNMETTSSKQTTTTTGNNVTVRTITKSATINNIWIVSDGDGSYSVKAHDNYPDVGDLAPMASLTVSFSISAHENISAGLYFPLVRVDVEDYQDVKFPIPVRVSNHSVHLLEKDVPSKVSSSGSTQISLSAVNKLQTTIKDVSVRAKNESTFELTPKSYYVGSMQSETSHDVIFSIHAKTLGKNELPLVLSYRNGENTHSYMMNLSLESVQTADVSPVLYDIQNQLQKGQTERITLEVFNAKTETITGVIVIPETNLTVSPSQYFIGSMDPDDVFSASFDISSEDASIGNYSIGFKVSYKQDNDYFESPTVSDSIEVISSIEKEETNLSSLFFVLLIGFIMVGLLFFKMRKKESKK